MRGDPVAGGIAVDPHRPRLSDDPGGSAASMSKLNWYDQLTIR